MPKTITVGVDIRDLQTAKTGTKTYLEELYKEFRKLKVPGVKFKFIGSTIPVYNGKNKILNLIGHFRYLVWKQLILPIRASFKRLRHCFLYRHCRAFYEPRFQNRSCFS